MKATLDHLLAREQDSIRRIVRLIHKATPRAEMIILFGCHVDTKPNGDYDILVVVKNKEIEDKILENIRPMLLNSIKKNINKKIILAPVNIHVENIDFINKKLEENGPSYSEITKTGIVLFDSKRFELSALSLVATKT